MQLIKFRPILQSKIWGGSALFKMYPQKFSEAVESDLNSIGESWELSDQLPLEKNSTVDGGNWDGVTLRSLLEKYPKEILGKSLENLEHFPLLYKFIDTQDYLSVQVHPGLKGVPILGQPKTECWYIVNAPEDAEIIVGLDTNLSKAEILSVLQTPDVKTILNHIPVKNGDVLFVPAGTVHAITPNLVIYELQQNSDDTFRLYDWDRLDKQGKLRSLHVEQASQVLSFDIQKRYKIRPLGVHIQGALVEYCIVCPFFVLKKYQFHQSIRFSQQTVFRVLTLLEGEATLEFNEEELTWNKGETVLLPSCLEQVTILGQGTFLESFVPENLSLIENELVNFGFNFKEIKGLGQNLL